MQKKKFCPPKESRQGLCVRGGAKESIFPDIPALEVTYAAYREGSYQEGTGHVTSQALKALMELGLSFATPLLDISSHFLSFWLLFGNENESGTKMYSFLIWFIHSWTGPISA